jgi:hypothetical protein
MEEPITTTRALKSHTRSSTVVHVDMGFLTLVAAAFFAFSDFLSCLRKMSTMRQPSPTRVEDPSVESGRHQLVIV